MRMTGFLFAVLLGGAGCLGRYTAPTGSGASTSSSSGSSSSSPAANPDPGPRDGGVTPDASPAASGNPTGTQPADPAPDAGTAPPTTDSPACDALADCCNQLPPDDAAQCQDALTNASDGVCQAILDNLQQNGLCN
ncbi:MAG TPA: hypothetical protein VII38_19300 [Polyangia bacterium]